MLCPPDSWAELKATFLGKTKRILLTTVLRFCFLLLLYFSKNKVKLYTDIIHTHFEFVCAACTQPVTYWHVYFFFLNKVYFSWYLNQANLKGSSNSWGNR